MNPFLVVTHTHIRGTVSKATLIITYFLKPFFPCLFRFHGDRQVIHLLCTNLPGNSVFFYKLFVGIHQRPVFRHGKNTVTHFIEHTLEYFQLPLRSHSFRYITAHNQHIFLIQRENTVFVIMMLAIKIQFMVRSRNVSCSNRMTHIGMYVLISFRGHHITHVHPHEILVCHSDVIGFFVGHNFNPHFLVIKDCQHIR